VATDHVIESFRNELYAPYKRGDSIEPELWEQFHPLEAALRAMGITVWAMQKYEADDAIAAAVSRLLSDPRVGRIYLCTPDKDLAQCVVAKRVVQFDRRANTLRDEDGVRAKFGVSPWSIPDWLALVGDSADGYPGVPGWGTKSAATVLSRYRFLEDIPKDPARWDVKVRGAARLGTALQEHWQDALLFRDLATLRTEAVPELQLDDLRWRGPRAEFEKLSEALGTPALARQAGELASTRGDC